ncbi:MAG TPA: 7TM domain-containing protein [Candidatus Saccharimonadales bacterium]|nr:7TM domain-containing protein [Candidatus Saccharimonadales bacterium]
MRKLLLILAVTTIVGFIGGMLFFSFPEVGIAKNSIQDTSLDTALKDQSLGSVWLNPVKYLIRGATGSGVSAKTISLLLLLTVVTTFIAGVRHLIGLESFGMFLPAALSVVFVVIGPIFGIGLFLLIIGIASAVRFGLRKSKVRLQYLPRMAFILWAVVICVLIILFIAPFFGAINLSEISVLPLFILILLAEDFIRVQLGKSVKKAINLTMETLILAFLSYLILTIVPFQRFAILNPEILLLSVAVIDFLLGKYIGLRFLELWRFRKLIKAN